MRGRVGALSPEVDERRAEVYGPAGGREEVVREHVSGEHVLAERVGGEQVTGPLCVPAIAGGRMTDTAPPQPARRWAAAGNGISVRLPGRSRAGTPAAWTAGQRQGAWPA